MKKIESAKFHYDILYWSKAYHLGKITLCQIGDLFCNGGCEVPSHRQECYEISYIVSGKGVFIIDGQEIEASENQVFLNRPGQTHRIISSQVDPLRFLYMGFLFSEVRDHNEYSDVQVLFDSVKQFITIDTNDLQHTFRDAIRETISKRNMMPLMLETYVQQIIIGTYRDFLYDENVRCNNLLLVDSEEQIVYAILNYIECDNCTVNRLSELSAALGYSYSYLSQLFSKRMGCSIQSFFRKKLFSQAVEMMKEGKSVSGIATCLGYSTVYSFSRAFANYYGESPSCYRERLLKM